MCTKCLCRLVRCQHCYHVTVNEREAGTRQLACPTPHTHASTASAPALLSATATAATPSPVSGAPRPGFVYVLLDTLSGEVKIGKAKDVPKHLVDAKTFNRYRRVEAAFFSLDYNAAESIAHELMKRRHGRERQALVAEWEDRSEASASEWFAAPPSEATECARDGCLILSENARRAMWLADPTTWTGLADVEAAVFGHTPRDRGWSTASAPSGACAGPWLARDAVSEAIPGAHARAVATFLVDGGAGAGAGAAGSLGAECEAAETNGSCK